MFESLFFAFDLLVGRRFKLIKDIEISNYGCTSVNENWVWAFIGFGNRGLDFLICDSLYFAEKKTPD